MQGPSNAALNTGGTPDPLNFRRARPVGQLFADGTVLDAAVATTVVVPISGAFLLRLRGKLTGAGTFSFRYRRPAPYTATAYDNTVGAPHADVVVVANVEFYADISPGGEGFLAITWTPGGAATVTFLDQMQQ